MTTSYIAEIETRVAGIPCIIGVIEYSSTAGSYSYNAASDWDYYGHTDCDWEVCDSRGRPAPWLARKVTDKITREIEQEIAEYFN
ncbi:MAG: hypothetical protein NTX35_22445 [Verrucomicrobia bacterium]|nr:hypothetical protein [Verrucomicrobiota bacterium]